ncbi:PD-(D/E)XK motif protein [Myxococcus sp. SDU36]|uniref:PD-(D/E)XK motif protein n=1 Tax=Myxococcus sp. SDU36 TaxID=2831967 RepID=UPI002542F2A7|nr:PD-(D/E)XK motif protein [Myxococcus sp. SDU36]WIG93321.1 PD-(D/E)XK motif protein [Myxococcus sp. SDU36]
MAPPIDAARLITAWRALSGSAEGEGWRTIPIEVAAPCRLLAGRHFPGDEEVVLVGFREGNIPPDSQLPQGHGFRVAKLATGILGNSQTWLALSRKAAGSLDLFVMMAGDVVALLENCSSSGEAQLLQLFLSRIMAWQNFMGRSQDNFLSQEAEVGLFGEMVVLQQIIQAGVPQGVALEAWQGPLGSLQDYMIGSGAIEVKTTVAPSAFLANIGSLEQLDETLRHPLFLAAVRLALSGSGKTLPELTLDIRGLLGANSVALTAFERCLVHAGYLEVMSHRYLRRFTHSSTALLPVAAQFPRLTRQNVNISIKSARYELDLASVMQVDVGLVHALQRLGAI